jgi:hypothetical protein
MASRELLKRLRSDVQHARICGQTYDLDMLHYLVRTAKPRAKSVWWRGVRFPLGNGLATRWALDPETGQTLVGAVG